MSFLGIQHDLPDRQCVMVDVLTRQRVGQYFAIQVLTCLVANSGAHLTIQKMILSVVVVCVATEVVVLVNVSFRFVDVLARRE